MNASRLKKKGSRLRRRHFRLRSISALRSGAIGARKEALPGGQKVIAESKKESVNLQAYLVDQHAIMARSLTVQVERYVDELLEKGRAEE